MKLSEANKINLAILVPEVTIAPASAIGAVYCMGKFAPEQEEAVTQFVAKHIILPHIKLFDSLGGSLRHAHEKYDQQKREEAIDQGKPAPEPGSYAATPEERANTIASVLVKGSVALAADYAMTRLFQHSAKRFLKAPLVPHLASFELLAHMGGIAVMPTLFAGTAENINHGISKRLKRTFGLGEQKAEDISVPFTYVNLPGQLAAVLALAIAHGSRMMKG